MIDADAVDPDLPDEALVYDLLLSPMGMAIVPNTGVITWTPTNTQVGRHDVTVRVTDREGLLDFTSFVVLVSAVNVAPIANDDLFEARLGVELSIDAEGILSNDLDPNGDDLTAVLAGAPAVGDLMLNGDGSFSYLLEPPDRTTTVELELQCEITLGDAAGYQNNGTIAVAMLTTMVMWSWSVLAGSTAQRFKRNSGFSMPATARSRGPSILRGSVVSVLKRSLG